MVVRETGIRQQKRDLARCSTSLTPITPNRHLSLYDFMVTSGSILSYFVLLCIAIENHGS